ncbi:MAG: hypothetical protein IKF68_00685 [Erysipelotrichaceae bacterium]|nr:hypothetical protein [Erysipelotrichaceae bacterium]
MRILLQLFIFCLLFTMLVGYAVRGGAIEGLYFYPKPYQEEAYARGLAEKKTVAEKRKRFMGPFILIMFIALIFIIAFWNRVPGFKEAYLQALLFLEVMNWYDGIFIDRLWVGHSDFWKIQGMKDVPYVQTWPQVMKKRCILSLIWIAGAAVAAGIVTLIR